jgi:hypothetical protein
MLVLDQSMCRRKFGFISAIVIFICINPHMLARMPLFCACNFSGAKIKCLLSRGVPPGQ